MPKRTTRPTPPMKETPGKDMLDYASGKVDDPEAINRALADSSTRTFTPGAGIQSNGRIAPSEDEIPFLEDQAPWRSAHDLAEAVVHFFMQGAEYDPDATDPQGRPSPRWIISAIDKKTGDLFRFNLTTNEGRDAEIEKANRYVQKYGPLLCVVRQGRPAATGLSGAYFINRVVTHRG